MKVTPLLLVLLRSKSLCYQPSGRDHHDSTEISLLKHFPQVTTEQSLTAKHPSQFLICFLAFERPEVWPQATSNRICHCYQIQDTCFRGFSNLYSLVSCSHGLLLSGGSREKAPMHLHFHSTVRLLGCLIADQLSYLVGCILALNCRRCYCRGYTRASIAGVNCIPFADG